MPDFDVFVSHVYRRLVSQSYYCSEDPTSAPSISLAPSLSSAPSVGSKSKGMRMHKGGKGGKTSKKNTVVVTLGNI